MSAAGAISEFGAVPRPAPDGPVIGVVIPAFGHPRFLVEAIVSAAEQEGPFAVRVVVVDDGCRDADTAAVIAAMAARYPGTVHGLRQPNTRLPGARNAGVRFLLALEPEMDSLFFLDADNRLAPYSLARYRDALGDDPALGWAYPDIAFFGQSWGLEGFDVRETAPDYSVLKHLQGNISEAGSLVRADLFHKGVWFDEEMRSGFEDWDFWLNALAAGYRGVRAADSGFFYRRRPESMLADARRGEQALLSHMRAKHGSLFQPRFLLETAHREAPHLAFVMTDRDGAALFTDPLFSPTMLDLDGFLALIDQRVADPVGTFFPDRVLIGPAAMLEALTGAGPHARGLAWALMTGPDVACYGAGGAGQGSDGGRMLSLSRARLFDGAPLETLPPTLELAFPRSPDALAPDGVPAMAETLLSRVRARPFSRRHQDRRYAGPAADRVRRTQVDRACTPDDGMAPLPMVVTDGARPVLIAAPERALTAPDRLRALITSLTERGGSVSLLVETQRGAAASDMVPPDLLAMLENVFVLRLPQGGAGVRPYLGRSVPVMLGEMEGLRAESLLVPFSAVLALGGGGFLEVLGAARARGVRPLVWAEDALLPDGLGRDDLVARLLAYEHAPDAIALADTGLRRRLSAAGVPAAKLVAPESLAARLLPDRPGVMPPGRVRPGWRPRLGYVFVVTYGRSGSTLLQTVLQTIEGMHFRGENGGALWPLYLSYLNILHMQLAYNFRRPVPPTGPWYGADEVAPGDYARTLADGFTRQVLRPAPEATRVGFKEIRYSEVTDGHFDSFLDFLRLAFPGLKLVFNTRDWRQVAKSSWWRDAPPEKVEAMVADMDARFAAYAARHPESSFTVRYDDYTDRPGALAPLFDFLDAPFDQDRVAAAMARRLKH
ncbi:glycosyltransferase [Yunchengibacter salinarum]|uniref:glycosyltransferase n=1 Tax=Yunchengibacter salinarum TaxID=3133399 RepID=UPI0035B63BCA